MWAQGSALESLHGPEAAQMRTTSCLIDLGNALLSCGDLDQAQRCLEQAAEQQRATQLAWPPEHITFATMLNPSNQKQLQPYDCQNNPTPPYNHPVIAWT